MSGHVKGVFPSPTVPYLLRMGQRWGKSGATFGVGAFLAVSFFCDWKDVLQFVPVLNDKFKKQE